MCDKGRSSGGDFSGGTGVRRSGRCGGGGGGGGRSDRYRGRLSSGWCYRLHGNWDLNT